MGILLYIVVAVLALTMLLFAGIFFSIFGLWLMCFTSGAPVSVLQIVGMRLRRTPARLICQQRIKAKQSGTELSTTQLERAYLQGADVEKLTDAMILALRTDRDVTWEQLVDAELAAG